MRLRLVRFTRLLLLVSSLVFSAPVSSASAARPVCATSGKAAVDLSDVGVRRPVQLWAKVCRKDSTLNIELRQQNMGLHHPNVPAIDVDIKIVIYSTTTNGRFLKDIEFTDTRWVGDATSLFPVGSSKSGLIVYKNSVALDDLQIPVLRPGRYVVGFEISADHPDDDVPAAASKVKYLKFKV